MYHTNQVYSYDGASNTSVFYEKNWNAKLLPMEYNRFNTITQNTSEKVEEAKSSAVELGRTGKPKRNRTMFTNDQLNYLENCYKETIYLETGTRLKIAKKLNLSDCRVKVWFQNRRMKEKREMGNTVSKNLTLSPLHYLSSNASSSSSYCSGSPNIVDLTNDMMQNHEKYGVRRGKQIQSQMHPQKQPSIVYGNYEIPMLPVMSINPMNSIDPINSINPINHSFMVPIEMNVSPSYPSSPEDNLIIDESENIKEDAENSQEEEEEEENVQHKYQALENGFISQTNGYPNKNFQEYKIPFKHSISSLISSV